MSQQLPQPATNTDFYLYAIAVELEALRTVTGALYELAQQMQKSAADQRASEALIDLREQTPASKSRRRHRDAEPVADPTTGRPST